MSQSSPLITVVIANYNKAHYLKELLESLSHQTFKDFKVLFVDDCSTDESCEIVKSFIENGELDLKIIKHEYNKGLGEARNTGLSICTTEFITFIDSDDYLTVNSLQSLINAQKIFSADIVTGSFNTVDVNSNFLESFIHKNRNIRSAGKKYYLGGVCVSAWSRLYRTELFKKVVGNYPKGYYEDVIPYLKIISSNLVHYEISDIVYCYRKDPSSICHQPLRLNDIDNYLSFAYSFLSTKDFSIFLSRVISWYPQNIDLDKLLLSYASLITSKNIINSIFSTSIFVKLVLKLNEYPMYPRIFRRLYFLHLLYKQKK